ncbi:MAG: deoxyribodipyrimidine photo-lyase, partial [Chryseobacterium sp.]
MSEKQKINILWFTKDLRIRDNESLYRIMQEDLPFLAVYIFDKDFFKSKQFGFRKIGKFRAKFLLESVLDLEKSLDQKKIPFLKKFGKTQTVFKQISDLFEIEKIFCEKEWTQEEIDVENEIRTVLPTVKWSKSHSQFLLKPEFVEGKLETMPLLFTNFRQKIEKDLEIRNEFISDELFYNKSLFDLKIKNDDITLKTLGFDDFESH